MCSARGAATPRFSQSVQGSLPEAITEGDLATLNSGLGFLFAWLREARQQHDKDQMADGSRQSLRSVPCGNSLTLFNSPLAEGLHVPILKLMEALAALDQNNVLPVLRPVARAGRAPSSHAYASLQGHAAGAVNASSDAGSRSPSKLCACRKRVDQAGCRPDRGRVASRATRYATGAITWRATWQDMERQRSCTTGCSRTRRSGDFVRSRPLRPQPSRSPRCANTSERYFRNYALSPINPVNPSI